MTSLVTGAALIGSVAAQLAHEAPVTPSSSISPVEYVTAGALGLATFFSFWFWYVANKPNVIIKPTLTSGSTTVVITNMGKSQAIDGDLHRWMQVIGHDGRCTHNIRSGGGSQVWHSDSASMNERASRR